MLLSAGCNKLPWGPRLEVADSIEVNQIYIVDNGKVSTFSPRAGDSLLLVQVKFLRPGSTEDIRVIGADNREYEPIGSRLEPLGGILQPFVRSPFTLGAHAEVKDHFDIFIPDVAFILPSAAVKPTMELKTRTGGGTIKFSIRLRP